MTDTAECETLTQALLSTIRLQRHQAARVIVSTQEPTISTKLLDLCSITIVHRFTSPNWLLALKAHLAGATALNKIGCAVEPNEAGFVEKFRSNQDFGMELFAQILALRTGEALLFSPSAVIGIRDLTRDGIMIEDSPHDTERRASYSTSTDSDSGDSEVKAELLRLGHNFMKVVVRQRITQDGGRSVMAA